MKRNIRLKIRYDGTKYKGWQRQKTSTNNIQGKIEDCLSRILNENIEIFGSGRTDAGVHANMQVANFFTSNDISCDLLYENLNKYLPEDIAVYEVKDVKEKFHCRYNARKKTYLYRIWIDTSSPIFERKYVYNYGKKLNVDLMREAARLLIGEHDFQGFCKRKMKKSTVRNIEKVDIKETGSEIKIYITANGFLYGMMRIIVGTLIEIGQGTQEVNSIKEILNEGVRSEAGFTAPPQGLSLYRVEYS